VLLLNKFLLLFISLSTQSGNFRIYPRIRPLPQYVFMARCLVKHRKNFTFTFSTASRPALGPTQSSLQGVPGVLFSGVNRPVHEVDNSFPFTAKDRNAWCYTSTPYVLMAWCLVKQWVRLHGVVLS